MQDTYWIIFWVVVIGGLFGWLWYAGHLVRFADYVKATREELRKCTWPSWDELKGSTVVVAISLLILGGFVFCVDFLFTAMFSHI